MADEHALIALAARQHGLASREQLLHLGFTGPQILGRVRRGVWSRAAPRVYDIAPAGPDPCRPVHAATLASGGWASHRSAAWLLGLLEQPPPRPELVVPIARTPKGLDAVVHRSLHLPPAERTKVDGIWCTAPLRTLLDVASVVGDEELEHLVARSFTDGHTTARRLLRYLDRPLAGRPGVAALRAAASQYLDRTAETQSRLEVIVDRAVRRHGIPRPVRQLRVRVDGRRFDLVFAWPAERLFLEADGFRHHASPAALARDHRRQNALVLAGWLPLHFGWTVARHQPQRVETAVIHALQIRSRSLMRGTA
jgi:very-short-patch-repair endonuclease